jgi:VanZ family protein
LTIKHPLKLTLSWLAVLLLMLVMFLFSAQPAGFSNSNSVTIAAWVVETTVKLTGAEIPELEKQQLIIDVNNVGREYMHGVVFLVLGLLVQNAVTQSGARGIRAPALALAICVTYGLAGEIHQLFVPGRAFQATDLAMDTAGSITGIAIMWFVYNIRRVKP